MTTHTKEPRLPTGWIVSQKAMLNDLIRFATVHGTRMFHIDKCLMDRIFELMPLKSSGNRNWKSCASCFETEAGCVYQTNIYLMRKWYRIQVYESKPLEED